MDRKRVSAMVGVPGAGSSSDERERGQILALFAGSFLVLLLVTGLVVDSGFAFFQRRHAQNVSDLATIAGTTVVAADYVDAVGGVGGRVSSDVYAGIGASAQANGCTAAANCSWTAWYIDTSQTRISAVTNDSSALPAGTLGVEVDVHWPTSTFIVGPVTSALGMQSLAIWDVKTTAAALTVDSTTQVPPGVMLPLALYGQSAESFTAGDQYQITDATLNTPGNFGWLSWLGAQDAGTLLASVCSSNNPAFSLPNWIDGTTGAKNAGGTSQQDILAIEDCLNTYMENQVPVLIPVYDSITGTGSGTQYHIIGVVSMVITNVNFGPAVKSIQGTFQNTYMFQPGVIPANAPGTPPAPGSKFYYIGLVH